MRRPRPPVFRNTEDSVPYEAAVTFAVLFVGNCVLTVPLQSINIIKFYLLPQPKTNPQKTPLV